MKTYFFDHQRYKKRDHIMTGREKIDPLRKVKLLLIVISAFSFQQFLSTCSNGSFPFFKLSYGNTIHIVSKLLADNLTYTQINQNSKVGYTTYLFNSLFIGKETKNEMPRYLG